MSLEEGDIWNRDEAVRDAAVRGFLADELFWSTSRWESIPHSAGWLSNQYKERTSEEDRQLLFTSVVRCLEDVGPAVRAAATEFLSDSAVRDDGSIFSLLRKNAELFGQTPYPYSDQHQDIFSVLTVVLARSLPLDTSGEIRTFLRSEIERGKANLVLVSAMASTHRDQDWMLSQAPKLLARQPESVSSYMIALGELSEIEEFLRKNMDFLPVQVLREQLTVVLYSEEEADKMLARLAI